MNSIQGFLRRNLQIRNEKTKAAAYFSLVRPIPEYCSTVWSPYTAEKIHKVEMVQRRAARYVTNDYSSTSSVTSMLENLQWETLETRRAKAQVTMLYKINNDLVDIPGNQYLSLATRSTRSSHSHKFRHFAPSTDYYKFSFFPRTVSLWNSLPASVAEAPDLVSFKRELATVSI